MAWGYGQQSKTDSDKEQRYQEAVRGPMSCLFLFPHLLKWGWFLQDCVYPFSPLSGICLTLKLLSQGSVKRIMPAQLVWLSG